MISRVVSASTSRDELRHPRALDVQLDLDADHCADEEGYQEDDSDGVYAQLAHFLNVLFEKHPHPFGA